MLEKSRRYSSMKNSFSLDFSTFITILRPMQNILSLITDTIHSLYDVDFSPEISVAPKPELGEYCINVFPLAKTARKAPNILSEEIATALAKHTDIFVSTNATGGYVNFFLTDRVWLEIFQNVTNLNPKEKNGKKAIMEIFSLNVGKPLHI
jgi:arginyl-tRNA synthetase